MLAKQLMLKIMDSLLHYIWTLNSWLSDCVHTHNFFTAIYIKPAFNMMVFYMHIVSRCKQTNKKMTAQSTGVVINSQQWDWETHYNNPNTKSIIIFLKEFLVIYVLLRICHLF